METGISYLNRLKLIKQKYLYLIGLILILLSLLASYIYFTRNLNKQKDEILNTGSRMALLFEHEISIRTHTVKALQLLAQRNLEGDIRLSSEVNKYLYSIKEKNGYSLKLLPGYTEDSIGNITGMGDIPETGSLAEEEMNMAISLSPIFQTVIERDPETPWVYYTSMSNFIYLYPRVNADEFFFTAKLLELDFVKLATPYMNPSKRVFWTPVYLDEAGKGYMVTVSAPVYKGSRFCGAVSLDISITRLEWLLKRYEADYSSFYLMYSGGRSLVGNGSNVPKIAPEALPRKKLVSYGKDWIAVFELPVENWYIVVKSNNLEIVMSAIMHSVPFALVAIFMSSGIILIINLLKALLKVEQLSTQDSLTGVYNRRMFDIIIRDELSRINRQKTTIGIMMFDVDYFKKYNDRYGHQEGDTVLINITDCIKDILKRVTDKIFRVGGEEFVVSTLIDSKEQLFNMMELVRVNIESLNIVHEASPYRYVTISIGAALIDGNDGLGFEDVYKKIDEALYKAKDLGRNKSCLS